MDKSKHLPLFGVGPLYVCVVIVLTVAAVFLSRVPALGGGYLCMAHPYLLVLGVALAALGVLLWVLAVVFSKIDANIERNTLVTTGVYAWVRNPIYSAFMLVSTGVVLMLSNAWLFVVPLLDWLFMTVLMKRTEEKWLLGLYGKEYEDYCKRVNRCWPWFPGRG